MKRFFKICLIFLLGLLIMIGVNGCMLENKDDFQFSENDIEKVEQAFKEYNNNTQKSFDAITTELSEKYGDSFEIQKVRNITGTEYIQAYVTSGKYPDVTFDAWVDRMTKEVTDDYLSMLIGFKIQQKLTESLNECDIRSYSKVTLLLKNKHNITDTDMDVKLYLAENGAEEIIIHTSLMMNTMDTNMANDLIKTVLELSKEYNVNFLFSGYLLVDDYESCVNDMKATPSVNEPWYGGYNVLKRFYFSIKNGVATKTATELLNSMDSESGGELNGIFR